MTNMALPVLLVSRCVRPCTSYRWISSQLYYSSPQHRAVLSVQLYDLPLYGSIIIYQTPGLLGGFLFCFCFGQEPCKMLRKGNTVCVLWGASLVTFNQLSISPFSWACCFLPLRQCIPLQFLPYFIIIFLFLLWHSIKCFLKISSNFGNSQLYRRITTTCGDGQLLLFLSPLQKAAQVDLPLTEFLDGSFGLFHSTCWGNSWSPQLVFYYDCFPSLPCCVLCFVYLLRL